MNNKRASVVGAGILGLAVAKTLAELGYKVTVIERSLNVRGSSIRNFGMVWPIGQHIEKQLSRAIKSREVWLDICEKGNIWNNPCGSIQLFTNEIELEMAVDFYEQNIHVRKGLRILSKDECRNQVSNLNELNILGGLYSDTEVIVESREAIRQIPAILASEFAIDFIFGKTVIEATNEKVVTSDGTTIENDVVFICSGFEINILYPEVFNNAPITISQLNMLRSKPVESQIPAICGGLSFLHYEAYSDIKKLSEYQHFCEENYPNQLKHGIHLLVSQNQNNCLTIGDSHEYNMQNDPFQEIDVNNYILDYYNELFTNHDLQITQTWMGEYLKMKDGSSEWIEEIEPGVFIFNGPGGAGMTLGFGMADDAIPKLLR
jgi:FAD dependent oxidoreductase TIGR03364